MAGPNAQSRGTSLVECLVYIAVSAILLGMLGPLFATGMQISVRSAETLEVVRQADAALEVIRSDVRQAATVFPPPADAGPEHARLIVRFADGSGAAYFLREGSLIRYEIPRGQVAAEGTHPGDDRKGRALPGEVERLDVSPLAGADRVQRVDIAFRMHAIRAHWQGSRWNHARFVTAVRQLPAETP